MSDAPSVVERFWSLGGQQVALDDWRLDVGLHLVLPPSAAPPVPTRPLRAAAADDWAAIGALFRLDHLEEDARTGRPARPEPASDAAARLRRCLTPPVTYFVAEEGAGIRGFVAVWVDADGTAMIEDVFVHPGARGAGLATDMLRFAVAHARARGAGPVLIGADVDDTPKHLYARFGFRPAGVVRSWLRAAPDHDRRLGELTHPAERVAESGSAAADWTSGAGPHDHPFGTRSRRIRSSGY